MTPSCAEQGMVNDNKNVAKIRSRRFSKVRVTTTEK